MKKKKDSETKYLQTMCGEPGWLRLSQSIWWRDKGNSASVSLQAADLARSSLRLDRASKELRFQFLATWLFLLEEARSSVPRSLCALAIACVPFVQHCLVTFLLTLPHCRTALCWLCPIFPLQDKYKMLHFLINLLGVTQTLDKTSWSQTLLSSLFSDPLVLPLRNLSLKNDLLVLVNGVSLKDLGSKYIKSYHNSVIKKIQFKTGQRIWKAVFQRI